MAGLGLAITKEWVHQGVSVLTHVLDGFIINCDAGGLCSSDHFSHNWCLPYAGSILCLDPWPVLHLDLCFCLAQEAMEIACGGRTRDLAVPRTRMGVPRQGTRHGTIV